MPTGPVLRGQVVEQPAVAPAGEGRVDACGRQAVIAGDALGVAARRRTGLAFTHDGHGAPSLVGAHDARRVPVAA
jgi:hypothetical protein